MRPRSRSDFAIAIICALTLEADAVEALFDETYDRLGRFYCKQPGDANSYVNGRIRDHNVVLCYMPGMGKGSAASVASSLRVSYTEIQLALVVGICGGAPYPSSDIEIFLGDVIISDAVVEYDFGRQYPGGFQRKTAKDILRRPDRETRTLLAGLKASRARNEFQDQMLQYLHKIQQSEARWKHPGYINDVLFEASYHHKHYQALENNCNSLGCDENRVCRRRDGTDVIKAPVHIGKVASADTVMKSGEHRDQIVRKERVIGFEMEGAGVWDNISCIIIKGVCDYADSHKNKKWQDYAAATAACGTKVFLGYWMPIAKIWSNSQLLIEQNSNLKDVQCSINNISAQSRVATVFIVLAFLYFRGVLLTLQTRLTRLINPWSELPAFLEDAHLRRFTIPLDTINTWEIFDFILEKHFVDMPGYQQVRVGSYVLEDSIARKELKHTNTFKACFRPGRRILMSMLFRKMEHEESSCPSCHAVNLDSGNSDVSCTFCGMQYRRITEVIEGINERSSSHSRNAKGSKGNPDGRHSFVGLKTPTEADSTDEEDVTQFKRVRIVAAPNFKRPDAASSEYIVDTTSDNVADADLEIDTARRNRDSKRNYIPPAPPSSLAYSTGVTTPPETWIGTNASNDDATSRRRRRRAERAQARQARQNFVDFT